MGRPSTSDNRLLGDFRITNIEQAKRGQPKVEVTFELDTNGILKVTAQDKKTGSAAPCQIADACKGLSEAEINKMVAEAEQYAQQDEELRQKIELRNVIESQCYEMRDTQHAQLAEETLSWVEGLDLMTTQLRALQLAQKKLDGKKV